VAGRERMRSINFEEPKHSALPDHASPRSAWDRLCR
jgi:hypothetical protein